MKKLSQVLISLGIDVTQINRVNHANSEKRYSYATNALAVAGKLGCINYICGDDIESY